MTSEAVRPLHGACAEGDAEARFELGRLLLARAQDEANQGMGCRLLAKAYAAGQRKAARLLADHHWNQRSLEPALQWYKRCEHAHDTETAYRLGHLGSLMGREEASHLERAAEAGHALACEEVGMRCALGAASVSGHRRQLKKAAQWFELAAQRGSSRASYLLAMLYRHPSYSLQDRRRSRSWLFAAAREGHEEARLHAGIALVKDLEAGRRVSCRDVGGDDPEVLAADCLVAAWRARFAEARCFLDRLAQGTRSAPWCVPPRWEAFVAFVASDDPDLAARLRLGHALALFTRELLTLDLEAADHDGYLLIDMCGRSVMQHRIVLIESEAQRRIVDEAKVMTVPPVSHGTGSAPPKYHKLRGLCQRSGITGIKEALFPRVERYRDANTARHAGLRGSAVRGPADEC